MRVIIDGVEFVPAINGCAKVGIAITTHQRPEVLKRAIDQHMKHLPAGALVVVVDDGSSPAAVVPSGVQLLRHDKSSALWPRRTPVCLCLWKPAVSIFSCGTMTPGQ